MIQIHYFYIFNYKAIKNVGIRLNGRYNYAMDTEKKVLTMCENPKWEEDFWPEGVSTLSAIVGKNGSGKTTFMEAMLLMVEKGNDGKEVDAMIVCRDEKGKFFSYIPENRKYEIKGQDVDPLPDPPKIGMFYYTPYFRPVLNFYEPIRTEVMGVYNASDTWRVIKDLVDYINVDGYHRGERMADYLDAFHRQNNNRIALLLANKGIRDQFPESAIPKYLLVRPSESGYKRWRNENRSNIYGVNNLGKQFWGRSKEEWLASIAYHHFYNLWAENKGDRFVIEGAQTAFQMEFAASQNVTSALLKTISQTPALNKEIRKLIEVMRFLSSACVYKADTDVLYIDLSQAQKNGIIEKFVEYFRDASFLTAHYFDFEIAREPAPGTQLSSGEYDMLKLFSRLYDAVILSPDKFANIDSPVLILLDEAENSYHPEWQRKFVKMLTDFLSAMYHSANIPDFQVVLSTHSPILLSDIPVVCTNYLRREGGSGNIVSLSKKGETFGANVYDLYKDSFFMENGLIGEFAYEWIDKLRDEIEKETKIDDDKADAYIQKIERVGDEVIRRYLFQLIEKKNKPSMVAYYKRKLLEFEGGKSYVAD